MVGIMFINEHHLFKQFQFTDFLHWNTRTFDDFFTPIKCQSVYYVKLFKISFANLYAK